MSESPEPPPPLPLLEPATSLLTYVLDERRLANITERALHLISQMEWVLPIVREKVRPDDEKGRKAIESWMEVAATDAPFANDEYEAGCPKTYAHHLGSLWGAIESALEQLLVNHLLFVPSAAGLVAVAPRGLTRSKIKAGDEDEARATVRRWGSTLQSATALAGPLEMLARFSFRVEAPDDVVRQVNELAELRNVILHRAGVVDARFVKKCPGAPWAQGETVRLNETATRGYFDAAGEFALALVTAATKSPHVVAAVRARGAASKR